jgi:hypothetical protein
MMKIENASVTSTSGANFPTSRIPHHEAFYATHFSFKG